MRSGKVRLDPVWKAFDEAEFGAKNSLNLRDSLPSAADAAYRTEAWLRERQVSGAKEVLIITGRGNRSPDGISVVRKAVLTLLPTLHRRGVVSEWREHSPGSLVVGLQPIAALLNAPRRKGDRDAAAADPQALSALDKATLKLLRTLAIRSLDSLGVRDPESFIEAEMLEKFNSLAASIPPGEGSETRLQKAITTALEQLDE